MDSAPMPLWVKIVIVVAMLPGLFLPFVSHGEVPAEGGMLTLLKIYPLYVVGAGVCAWLCYRQRPALAWILVALLVLSHIGVYLYLHTLPL